MKTTQEDKSFEWDRDQ